MSEITSFSGRYRFLSNFWRVNVGLDGEIYSSVEHAYQAAKFPQNERKIFQHTSVGPEDAKSLGRGRGGPDWKNKSLDIMLGLLRQKFSDPNLRRQLLETGDSVLVEGNHWGDTFFGVCNGVGENHLGKMLMKVREEIKPYTSEKIMADLNAMRFPGEYGSSESLPDDYVKKITAYILELLEKQRGKL